MDRLRAKLERTHVSRTISGISYIFQNILIILRPKMDSLLKKIISRTYRIHAEYFSQSSETQKSLLVSFQCKSHPLFYGLLTRGQYSIDIKCLMLLSLSLIELLNKGGVHYACT